MKNIFFSLTIMAVAIVIAAGDIKKDDNCKEKDKLIHALMKFNERLTNDQLGIREVRKHWAFVVYNIDNIDKDTSLLQRIKAEIMKTDSTLKNVNERMDFTAEELNSFYKKYELASSKQKK